MSRHDDIQLLRVNYLRGPNMWTYRPVLEVWLDLGRLEEFPSHKLEGFNERLTAALPALVEHHCGVGERGPRVISKTFTRTRLSEFMAHLPACTVAMEG